MWIQLHWVHAMTPDWYRGQTYASFGSNAIIYCLSSLHSGFDRASDEHSGDMVRFDDCDRSVMYADI